MLRISLVFALIVLTYGCTPSERYLGRGGPDMAKLRSISLSGLLATTNLYNDVGSFYLSLKRKEWNVTYEYRTNQFKKLVKKEGYVRRMEADGKKWDLVNYNILKVNGFGPNRVRLIMEFFEEPGSRHTYEVVWWKYEGGVWHCEEEGPSGLQMSKRMIFSNDYE